MDKQRASKRFYNYIFVTAKSIAFLETKKVFTCHFVLQQSSRIRSGKVVVKTGFLKNVSLLKITLLL